jgi:hypothetical protein
MGRDPVTQFWIGVLEEESEIFCKKVHGFIGNCFVFLLCIEMRNLPT